MIRLTLIFMLAFSISLLSCYHMHELAALIFQELLSSFIVLTTITGTISYALYSYVEGVAKDVAADKNKKSHTGYYKAIKSLSNLKKEVLINAFAIIGLLILERFADGLSLVFPISHASPFNWIWAASLSIRVACFILGSYIATIQFHGFIIANEYRLIISREK